MPERKAKKKTMSAEHKEALAIGRSEGRAVRNYLEALDAHRPKRGRKRTPDSIRRRLDAIEASLPEADPVSRVSLIQERMDLTNELTAMEDTVDMRGLEDEFVSVALSYSERRGISYAAWREAGIDASVLKKAGITRSM
jgi:hypothetical protein